jgi:hypothetical protein
MRTRTRAVMGTQELSGERNSAGISFRRGEVKLSRSPFSLIRSANPAVVPMKTSPRGFPFSNSIRLASSPAPAVKRVTFSPRALSAAWMAGRINSSLRAE